MLYVLCLIGLSGNTSLHLCHKFVLHKGLLWFCSILGLYPATRESQQRSSFYFHVGSTLFLISGYF